MSEYEDWYYSDEGKGAPEQRASPATSPAARLAASVTGLGASAMALERQKLSVLEAVQRWLQVSTIKDKETIVQSVIEHKAAMMAVMHALFWLGTIIIIHDRFVWAHLGLLLLTALFTLGGYPVWAQRSATQRLHFRTTHTLLQLFFVLLLGYVLVQAVVCVATCAAARLIINRYCKDQSRLCRPGAVSHDWLRFGFIAGVISLSSSFVALAFYMARYVFVYIVFLEWAHRRHAAPGSVELALWGPVRKIGGMLVRAGISLKKCLCFCCQLEDDHDSEVDEAVPDHHYATHVASRKSEQRRADAAAVDEEAAEQSGSEQDEGWLNLFTSSHTSSDDLVTYACLCCCCICCLGSLVGCIVVNGVLGDIFCLIFEIIVRSA